jgi:hypothetical protein
MYHKEDIGSLTTMNTQTNYASKCSVHRLIIALADFGGVYISSNANFGRVPSLYV